MVNSEEKQVITANTVYSPCWLRKPKPTQLVLIHLFIFIVFLSLPHFEQSSLSRNKKPSRTDSNIDFHSSWFWSHSESCKHLAPVFRAVAKSKTVLSVFYNKLLFFCEKNFVPKQKKVRHVLFFYLGGLCCSHIWEFFPPLSVL